MARAKAASGAPPVRAERNRSQPVSGGRSLSTPAVTPGAGTFPPCAGSTVETTLGCVMKKNPKSLPLKERASDEKSGEVISSEGLRRPSPDMIDQRQQQMDPAGRYRIDPNARPHGNTKQPGGSGTTSTPTAIHGDEDAEIPKRQDT